MNIKLIGGPSDGKFMWIEPPYPNVYHLTRKKPYRISIYRLHQEYDKANKEIKITYIYTGETVK